MTDSVIEKRQWLAVLGGATRYSDEQLLAACRIGRAIARQGRHLMTGGTSGIPFAAALAAQAAGALVVGISPAMDPAEHVTDLGKPLDSNDLIVYSGLRFDGRSPLIVRSVPGMFFVGGEFGTLNEFTSAWLSGNKVLGVLEGSGGVTDQLRSLVGTIQSNWDNVVLFDSSPERLVERVCAEIDARYATIVPATEDERHQDVRDFVQRFLVQEGV